MTWTRLDHFLDRRGLASEGDENLQHTKVNSAPPIITLYFNYVKDHDYYLTSPIINLDFFQFRIIIGWIGITLVAGSSPRLHVIRKLKFSSARRRGRLGLPVREDIEGDENGVLEDVVSSVYRAA